jgi:hypothetical protein
MNGTLSKVLIFVAGAAIGSVATWAVVKTKYEKIAKEEIESVKETFSKRYEREEEANEPEIEPEEKPEKVTSMAEYKEKIVSNGYTDYANIVDDGDDERLKPEPYVISPEEFNEINEYDSWEYTYYEGDNTLTDDNNWPIQDVDNTVGDDFMTHFGDYEDDSVFIRNDRLKTDIQILLDSRRYSDVVKYGPGPTED